MRTLKRRTYCNRLGCRLSTDVLAVPSGARWLPKVGSQQGFACSECYFLGRQKLKRFIVFSFSLHTAAVGLRVVGERSLQVVIPISLICIVCLRNIQRLRETGKHVLCEWAPAARNFGLSFFIPSGNARAKGLAWAKVFVAPHATELGGNTPLAGWGRTKMKPGRRVPRTARLPGVQNGPLAPHPPSSSGRCRSSSPPPEKAHEGLHVL